MSSQKSTPANMNLIDMVQQARMAHDREALPSQVSGVYWIESKPLGDVEPPTAHTGDWMITTTLEAVDALWITIRTATEQGLLGYKSKVATIATKGRSTHERVIVVRTYDADDRADVARVEAVLRGMGITDMQYERLGES
ncbi:MAG: DUF1917 domain-containing protein [Chloroflexi bacterium]|nr:DUF1917 domain-containing protein [Chloroflexota bacterium]MCC6894879.1 DUF1917 domain-containing protein [Anaerolineae bacterium]